MVKNKSIRKGLANKKVNFQEKSITKIFNIRKEKF